jgi:hypothetical protein
LRDDHGDAYAHGVLESLHVGGEVGVEVVRVEGRPELRVGSVDEVRVQGGEM